MCGKHSGPDKYKQRCKLLCTVFFHTVVEDRSPLSNSHLFKCTCMCDLGLISVTAVGKSIMGTRNFNNINTVDAPIQPKSDPNDPFADNDNERHQNLI